MERFNYKRSRKNKKFYEKVVGWTTSKHDMGSYHDYNVHLEKEQEAFSGICYQRDTNQDIPNVWMNYIYVDDVQKAVDVCVENGGSVLVQRKMGSSDFAILQDPSGAIFAVIH